MVTVVDSSGQMVADRVRVTWGRVQNFKCVDYYQIEYWNEEEPEESFAISEKINRHRDSHDITIKPCRNYLFKVELSQPATSVRRCIAGDCFGGLERCPARLQGGVRHSQVPCGLRSQVHQTSRHHGESHQNTDLRKGQARNERSAEGSYSKRQETGRFRAICSLQEKDEINYHHRASIHHNSPALQCPVGITPSLDISVFLLELNGDFETLTGPLV